MDWYKKFGEQWWGDISKVLTPFPIVAGKEVFASEETAEEVDDKMVVDGEDKMTLAKKRKVDGQSVAVQA